MDMNTNEKSYIKILKGLFDRGEEEEIKKYILGFNENDDDYDIFIEKLQEFVRTDNMDVVEELVYDDEMSLKSETDDYDFEDEQDFESYLLDEQEETMELERIPDEKDDEEDESPIKEILGKLGIEDLNK